MLNTIWGHFVSAHIRCMEYSGKYMRNICFLQYKIKSKYVRFKMGKKSCCDIGCMYYKFTDRQFYRICIESTYVVYKICY